MRSAGAIAVAVMLSATAARAQGVPWVPTLSVDPSSAPTVEGTSMPAQLEPTVNAHFGWAFAPARDVGVRGYAFETWGLQLGLGGRFALAARVPFTPVIARDAGGADAFVGDTRFVVRWMGLNAGSVLGPSAPLSSVRCGGRCGRGWSIGGGLAFEATVPGNAPFAGYGVLTLRAAANLELRYLHYAIGFDFGYRLAFDGSAAPPVDRFTLAAVVRHPVASVLAMLSPLCPPLADAAAVLAFLMQRSVGVPYLSLALSFDPKSRADAPVVVELGFGAQRQFGSVVFGLGASWRFGDVEGPVQVVATVGWRPPADEDNDGVPDDRDHCIGLRGPGTPDGCPRPEDRAREDPPRLLDGRTYVHEIAR